MHSHVKTRHDIRSCFHGVSILQELGHCTVRPLYSPEDAVLNAINALNEG